MLTPVTSQFKKVLTSEDLTALAKSGASESDLLQAIEGNEVRFDTSAGALLALKNAGLSDGVVLAMLSAAGRGVTESVVSPNVSAPPPDVGVYHVRGDQRVPISPEAFKWKEEFLGSASKPGWLSRLDKTTQQTRARCGSEGYRRRWRGRG